MEDKKLYNAVRKIITLADGRQIEIETGKLAKQADGSVVVKQGDTMLLATVVAAKDAKPDTDFMPLQVEYKEKYASCGRYPGGFMKREGRANDSEILVARLIDRALRPLFPADYHAEVYVTVNLISADKDIQPDALAGLAASAALAVSDIPFGGPISEVRVARLDGEYVINPKFSEMDRVDLDIMVGGTIDNILMVEGEMKEVSEEVMLGAIKFAHEEIKKHCAVQIELSKELGKDVKRTYCHEENDEELRQLIVKELYDKAYAIATSGTMKHEREDMFNALEAEFAARYSEEELAENADFLAKSAIRQIEARNKRQLTAKTAESLRQLTGITRSWLRDIMVQVAGASDQVVNADVRTSIEEAAARTDAARAAAAIAAVRRCDVAISYNVSPETCIDAMLLEVRDILYGRALPNAAPRAYAR